MDRLPRADVHQTISGGVTVRNGVWSVPPPCSREWFQVGVLIILVSCWLTHVIIIVDTQVDCITQRNYFTCICLNKKKVIIINDLCNLCEQMIWFINVMRMLIAYLMRDCLNYKFIISVVFICRIEKKVCI